MHGGMWGSGGNAMLDERWWKCVLEWRFGFLPLKVFDILDSLRCLGCIESVIKGES